MTCFWPIWINFILFSNIPQFSTNKKKRKNSKEQEEVGFEIGFSFFREKLVIAMTYSGKLPNSLALTDLLCGPANTFFCCFFLSLDSQHSLSTYTYIFSVCHFRVFTSLYMWGSGVLGLRGLLHRLDLENARFQQILDPTIIIFLDSDLYTIFA